MKAIAAVLAALVAVGVLMYVYTAPMEDQDQFEMTEAEIAQIEAEVLGFADAHLSAFGQLDADLLLSYWMEDNISSVSFAQRMVGTEETSTFFDGLVASWQQTSSEWQPGSIVDVNLSDDGSIPRNKQAGGHALRWWRACSADSFHSLPEEDRR